MPIIRIEFGDGEKNFWAKLFSGLRSRTVWTSAVGFGLAILGFAYDNQEWVQQYIPLRYKAAALMGFALLTYYFRVNGGQLVKVREAEQQARETLTPHLQAMREVLPLAKLTPEQRAKVDEILAGAEHVIETHPVEEKAKAKA